MPIVDDLQFVRSTSDFLRSRGFGSPSTAIVLGSGLGHVATLLTDPVTVPTADIPGFPPSTVPGHRGLIYYGRMGHGSGMSQPLLLFQGRIHPYEGGEPGTSSLNIRLSKMLGVTAVVLTNAAGGVNTDLSPGDLMLHDGIMTLPLHPERSNVRSHTNGIVDRSRTVYDGHLNQILQDCARDLGLETKRGVYCYVTGPSFETPAEVRMLRLIGADAVGMSTYPEVLEARNQGIRACGLTLISNKASGLAIGPLTHEDVSQAGRMAEKKVGALLARATAAMMGGS